MNRYRQYQEPQRRRINARPQNDPWAAAGATGLHRDTSGNVIGGYNGEGVSFGSKVRGGGARTPSQPAGGTAPATGNVLNSRINLFKEMEKAGADGITEEMRKKARALGVADESFNTAVGKIRTNAAATAPTTQEPGSRNPPQPPNQEAPTAPPAPRPEAPRVGKINGRPASEVLGELRKNPQYETAPRYGAEIGKANIKSMGIDGAIADYYKRSGQDKQKEGGAKVPASPAKTPTPSPALADTGKVDMPDIGKIAGRMGEGVSKIAGGAMDNIVGGIKTASNALTSIPPAAQQASKPKANWKTPPSKPVLANALKSDVKNLGDTLIGANNALGRGVQNIQKGIGNTAAAYASIPSEVATNLIPGQTGAAIRDLQIPKKIRKKVRQAGEIGASVVNAPFKTAARWRDSAFNAAFR